jgi:hypothetical protein
MPKTALRLSRWWAIIKGIYVREYEYDKPGQYNESDLAPLRAYLARPPWNKTVESKEGKETSEIYL